MSSSYNKVVLVGNLTRDIELRYTGKGAAIGKISLALNRKWKDKDSGESRDEVTFVEVDSFGRQAETLAQYLKKGSKIMIEGRLKLDTWEDKQTQQKRSKLGVMLESFTFLEGRQDGGGDSEPRNPAPKPQTASHAQRTPPPAPAPVDSNDDAPF